MWQSMSAAVLVWILGVAADDAARFDAALEDTLHTVDAVDTRAVTALPSERIVVDAAAGASVALIATDAEWSRVQLRVYTRDAARWQERVLEFGDEDARAARAQAVSLVLVAMLPVPASSSSPPPTPPVAPAPRSERIEPTPRKIASAPRIETGLSFAAALGAPSTFGAVGYLRVRIAEQLWVRIDAGVRAGQAPVEGSALDVPLGAGLLYRWSLSERIALGGRMDAALQLRQVGFEQTLPSSRSRWLGALRAGPELLVRLTPSVGLTFFCGPEVSFGRTQVVVAGERGAMGLARVYAEVGPSLTF